ncbi:MFS transporter [Streptomyces sp. enrichment culture]|uniref:MFS transporter n=1 Tax=Streptomyces sp. enrichment culture TaxID=1795815 RepID=UPI003F54A33F
MLHGAAGHGPGAALKTARRRYVIVCALFWLPPGLAMAPLVLLFTERGMALAAIAGFFAAHSLTVAAVELPTGGLSDALGRRPVLAAAGALNAIALLIVGLAGTAWVLVLGMVLMGTARALASGPAEAWYVDTVQSAAGPDADLRTGLARGSSATSAALALGLVLGGSVPWLLGRTADLGPRLTQATSGLVLPLSVPVLLGAAVEVLFLCYVLAALRELPRPPVTARSVLRGIPGVVLSGVRLGGRDAMVRRVLLSAAAAGSAVAAIELLMPGRAVSLTGAPESGALLFAALACGGFVCAGLGSHLAPPAARLTGSGERAVLAGLGTATVGLLLLGATAAWSHPVSTGLVVAAFGLVYLGLGMAGPNENELLHRRTPGDARATALSVQSLAQQSVGAVTGVVVGALAPGPLPWLLTACVLLAGTLLWIRRGDGPPASGTPGAPNTSGTCGVPGASGTSGGSTGPAEAGERPMPAPAPAVSTAPTVET